MLGLSHRRRLALVEDQSCSRSEDFLLVLGAVQRGAPVSVPAGELGDTGTQRPLVAEPYWYCKKVMRAFSTLMLEIPDMAEADRQFLFLEHLQGWAQLEVRRQTLTDWKMAVTFAKVLVDICMPRTGLTPQTTSLVQCAPTLRGKLAG